MLDIEVLTTLLGNQTDKNLAFGFGTFLTIFFGIVRHDEASSVKLFLTKLEFNISVAWRKTLLVVTAKGCYVDPCGSISQETDQ